MPIVIADYSGEPEAMHVPMILCDACDQPIHARGQGETGLGGIVQYASGRFGGDGRPAPRRLYFAHKGTGCVRRVERMVEAETGSRGGWDDIGPFLARLSGNYATPVPVPDGAELVAPAPSGYRQGRFVS